MSSFYNQPSDSSPLRADSSRAHDQGYESGGTPVFTCLFEPLARVTLYLTDENGLDSCFGAA